MARPPSPLLAIAMLLVLAVVAPARAATTAPLVEGGTATVGAVIDGDTLTLVDGRTVRLAGIQAPKLPLGRPEGTPWPLADAARAALAALVLDRPVRLSFAGGRTDRYGRALAQLHTVEGLWVQGEMLRRGLARVVSQADDRALAGEMLALESAARNAGRGLWADPFYRVRTIDEAAGAVDSFQLVEGRAARVTTVQGHTYVDFGVDWRSDFTLAIDAQARRRFAEAGLSPDTLVGRRLRVRGWIKSRNGPLIDVTHPEQIELLEP